MEERAGTPHSAPHRASQDQDRTPSPGRLKLSRRLSLRLLWLTMLAVMAAEVLIFVPSVANFRDEWLRARIDLAAVAALAAEGGEPVEDAALGPGRQERLLMLLGADVVAATSEGVSRLIARSEQPGMVDRTIHLAAESPWGMIRGSFATLLFGGSETLRIIGPVGDGSTAVEVVMPDRELRRAMLIYARNIFLLSLVIASFAALLVFLAINALLVQPIRRMTQAMMRFGANPEDPDRIITPSGRHNEIGVAEAELAKMQARLAKTLREQRHLADLGLAVSKINHDLRNILASAQLVGDRLADLPDPRVQRAAPLLIRNLDRAVGYTQSVLTYGQAVESAPVRRLTNLRRLVREVVESMMLAENHGIELRNEVPDDLEIDVDPDQFFRALGNLLRNALQALENDGREAVIKRIVVAASQDAAAGETLIAVEDTGPGLPPRARENLFQAFRGSARSGGTGLGLAIAAEIVQAHGGTLTLAERERPGARFEIRLPRRKAPKSRKEARRDSGHAA